LACGGPESNQSHFASQRLIHDNVMLRREPQQEPLMSLSALARFIFASNQAGSVLLDDVLVGKIR